MLVALDGTVLLVAQPALRQDLHAAPAQVQWTSTAYLLAVAALLVVAGRLGDRYGHTRLLLTGLVGFALTSAAIALAPGIGWAIALRAAQGVCAALLQPATLALLRLTHPADRLGGPIALRTSAIGVAAAAGPLIGGVLVAEFGWRSVFWLNVPVALVVAALALAIRVPVLPRTGGQRLGLPGAVLLAAALACLVHALTGVPEHGWTGGPTWAALALTALVAAGFVAHERRTAHPIVPTVVARAVPVTASMALLLITAAGMFGALFVLTFFLQGVRGLDPLACGVRVLPMTVLMVLGAPVASSALRWYGARRAALTGLGLVVAGVAGLAGATRVGAADAWLAEGAAFGVLGAGFATVMVAATGTVVGDAPPGYAGVVGGLKQTAMNIGPSLGIAVAAGTMGPGVADAPITPALLLLAGLGALGVIPAALLPGRREKGRCQTPVSQ
ncbi:MFS transporter [Streptomyces sp. NBC_00237]|uniref:MFS transporter n=1 Tax=Streptomyces sp. NBC_00237 TaxID=2975687 RepID=UPI0022543FF5|nr:MFS transporter [Streptomyces sp. NBC_00237]MCX5206604.1 MFS transporter [Streptomyces sp. NBC_00237]